MSVKTGSSRRNKKARLTENVAAAPTFKVVSAIAADVEIKTENEINEVQAAATTGPISAAGGASAAAAAELPTDIKPDINELNKELFGDPNTVVVPPSVLPTLFIISQMPTANVVNTAAAATAAGIGAGKEYNATATAAASNAVNVTGISTSAVNTARFFEDAMVKDELDQQESDSDEEGYSDIDFDDDDELVEGKFYVWVSVYDFRC